MATQSVRATQSRNKCEALTRAKTGQSMGNYPTIYGGFTAKGIPESEIMQRENVFTYNAWRALGRQVRGGEHGVKVLTFIVCQKREEERLAHRGGDEAFEVSHWLLIFVRTPSAA